jgi:hypothetical protein
VNPDGSLDEGTDMQNETWAGKASAKETLWLVFRLLSPFLAWGFLLFWVYMALQQP